MDSKWHLESERPVRRCMINETKCMVCENTVYKVRRIMSELIMLTCENCEESHMIGINSD
jgi:hypothetical protein